MPRLSEHSKCAKAVLGKSNRTLQILMCSKIIKHGYIYMPLSKTVEYLNAVGQLFGEEGKREAVIHMLYEWCVITKKDYEV